MNKSPIPRTEDLKVPERPRCSTNRPWPGRRGVFTRLGRPLAFLAALLLPAFLGAVITAAGLAMFRMPAPHLSSPQSVSTGAGSFGYCSSVGGVAFGAVAESGDGSRIARFLYHPARADGTRLEALVLKDGESHNVTLPVYDWQFVPPAKFAAGTQDALVTYFGHLSDAAEEQRLRAKGFKFVNYHEAIDNTLMGLRLMHADLLAFHQLGPLNLDDDGVPVKGPGETLGKQAANEQAIHPINLYYSSCGARSYIICDVDQRIAFTLDAKASRLDITGFPYWSCWTMDAGDPNQAIQALKVGMTVQEWNNAVEKYEAGIPGPFEKAVGFARLKTASQKLSEIMRKQEGGNPPVYRALTTFMRHAALFRHHRDTNAAAFQAFLGSIEKVEPRPQIETPTVIGEPGAKR